MRQFIRVANGKYTFVLDGMTSTFSILRHGEPWHGPQGVAVNAIAALMAELDAARVVMQEVRLATSVPDGMIPSIGLCEALEKHDRLVDDHEPPSEWCK